MSNSATGGVGGASGSAVGAGGGAAAGKPGSAASAGGGTMSVEKKLNCSLDDLVKLQRKTAAAAAAQQRAKFAGTASAGRFASARGGRGGGAASVGARSRFLAGGSTARQTLLGVQRTSRGIVKSGQFPARGGGGAAAVTRGRGGSFQYGATRLRGGASGRGGAGGFLGRQMSPGGLAGRQPQQQQKTPVTNAYAGGEPSLAERLAQPLEKSIAAAAAAARRKEGTGGGGKGASASFGAAGGKTAVTATTGGGGTGNSKTRILGGRALSAQRKFLASRPLSAARRGVLQRNIPVTGRISARPGALLLRGRGIALRTAGGAAPGAARKTATVGALGSRGTTTAQLRANAAARRALVLRKRAAASAAAAGHLGGKKVAVAVRRGTGAGLISKVARKRANKQGAGIAASGGGSAGSSPAAATAPGAAANVKRGRGTASAAGRAAAAANVRSSSSNSSTVATAGTPPRRSAGRYLRFRERSAVFRASQLPLNTSINRQAAWAATGGGGLGAGVGGVVNAGGGYVVGSGSSRVAAHAARTSDMETVTTTEQLSGVVHQGAVLRASNAAAAVSRQRLAAVPSTSDLELMSKIKIMATLEKVPPLLAAQRGLAVTPPHALLDAAMADTDGYDRSATDIIGAGGGNNYGDAPGAKSAQLPAVASTAAHLPYQSYATTGNNAVDSSAPKGRSLSDRFSKYAAAGGG